MSCVDYLKAVADEFALVSIVNNGVVGRKYLFLRRIAVGIGVEPLEKVILVARQGQNEALRFAQLAIAVRISHLDYPIDLLGVRFRFPAFPIFATSKQEVCVG